MQVLEVNGLSTLVYHSGNPGMVVLCNVRLSAFRINCAMVSCSGLTLAKSRRMSYLLF